MSKSNANKKGGRERRKGDRRVVHEKCTIFVSSGKEATPDVSQDIQGFATDISASSMGIVTMEPLKTNAQVVIMIKSRKFVHEFRATVVWCTELPSSGNVIKLDGSKQSWRAGLVFDPETDEDRELLKMVFEKL